MKRGIIFLVIASFICIATVSFAATQKQAPSFTGNNWAALSNAQKVNEVTAFIKDLRTKGVTVKGDPVSYCKSLDNFYIRHPNLKMEEVAKTLKTLMIMKYDWEVKGADKDAIAKEWLGDELYKKNKTRLGR